MKQGAIILTDSDWREGKAGGCGPAAAIVVENIPANLAGDANGVELVTLMGSLQVTQGIASNCRERRAPQVETDCKSLIRKGEKQYFRFGTRSLDNRKHGYAYRAYRRMRWKYKAWIPDWVRSHPERRKQLSQFDGPETRISLADKYAGCLDSEGLTESLGGEKFQASQYKLDPDAVHHISAKDILWGMYSKGDYCWVDHQDCPTTQTLVAEPTDQISEYLEERTEHAKKSGSFFPWKDSVVGQLRHMWRKAKFLDTRWKKRAAIQDIWDKRWHGRNQQKILKLAVAPKCPMCDLTTDSQAHIALRCSHPVLEVARNEFKDKVLVRMAKEEQGAGRAFLSNRWKWVFSPEEGSCSVAEEMGRMAFILGRPLSEHLQDADVDFNLTTTEREKLVQCVSELWEHTVEYMRSLWSLRASITAAPHEVQRTLRTQTATTADVKGLLQTPYYQQSHRTKARVWAASIAKFCERRTRPPRRARAETKKMQKERKTQESARRDQVSKWDPKWSQWKPTDSTAKARKSGRPPDPSTAAVTRVDSG